MRGSLLVVPLAVAVLVGCAAQPALSVPDPRSGEQVALTCGSLVEADCVAIAEAMLNYFPADAAAVEGITVEPLPDPPLNAEVAALVTVDHEVAFSSGEEAYRVVELPTGFEIEPVGR